jgi:hypothetical protein
MSRCRFSLGTVGLLAACASSAPAPPALDRQANRALYLIARARMAWCPRTRAYVARRTTEEIQERDHPLTHRMPETFRRW